MRFAVWTLGYLLKCCIIQPEPNITNNDKQRHNDNDNNSNHDNKHVHNSSNTTINNNTHTDMGQVGVRLALVLSLVSLVLYMIYNIIILYIYVYILHTYTHTHMYNIGALLRVQRSERRSPGPRLSSTSRHGATEDIRSSHVQFDSVDCFLPNNICCLSY